MKAERRSCRASQFPEVCDVQFLYGAVVASIEHELLSRGINPDSPAGAGVIDYYCGRFMRASVSAGVHDQLAGSENMARTVSDIVGSMFINDEMIREEERLVTARNTFSPSL